MRRILCLSFILSSCWGWTQEIKKDSISKEVEKQIEAIELVSKKKLVDRKADRLVFNVENSIAATDGDAMDALKVTPGVRVEQNKITLSGKSTLMVLIDDRPVKMSGEDLINYLRTIKSDDIKSIEVMTNPPAKYIAEGNSGVLNIITKKQKRNSWNASIRGGYKQGVYASGSLNGSFNFQKNKWTFTSSLGYFSGPNASEVLENIYYPNQIWINKYNGKNEQKTFSTRLGLDYKFSDKLTMGVGYNWVNSNSKNRGLAKTEVINDRERLERLILGERKTNIGYTLHTFNYHLIYKMDSIGRKMSFDYDMFTNSLDNDSKVISREKGMDLYQRKSLGLQNINNHSLNIDMEHPLEKINLNYGARFSFSKSDSDSKIFAYQNNTEVLDRNHSNVFSYRENTQALYFSADKKWGENWKTKLGMRLENTQTKGYSLTLNQTNKNQYTKLFPTVYVSYTPNDNYSFSLNYGKRLNRPYYGRLNPFRWISSQYSYSEGNPFLRPSIIHNVEMEYAYKEYAISTLYFSKEIGIFEELTEVDAKTNVIRDIPQNYINRKIVGFIQKFMFKPFKFWNVVAEGEVTYGATQSTSPVSLQSLNGWNAYFTWSNDFTLNKSKTLMVNVSYLYFPKGVDNLDYSSSGKRLDLSFKALFLKKKLVANLYFNDIFKTHKITYIGFSNGIKTDFTGYYDQRFFRLSLSYNFGKPFQKTEYRNKNQEEISRTN